MCLGVGLSAICLKKIKNKNPSVSETNMLHVHIYQLSLLNLRIFHKFLYMDSKICKGHFTHELGAMTMKV